jgi:hypothetical protein
MAEDGLGADALVMWTIYNSPPDHPGKFVARSWVARRGESEPTPTGHIAVAPTLEWVRKMIPSGLHCLARSEGDDPTIVETWL